MIQYQRTVGWDVTLIDLGFDSNGLVVCGLKATTGAPTVTAGKFEKGAILQNIVSGIIYSNTGTVATPVWSVIDVSAGGLPALSDGTFWLGDATNAATEVAMSGDATMNNAGVVTVTGATGLFEAGGAITNAGGTLAVGFIPTAVTSPQALSGAGAVNITTYQTKFTSTGTGDALTLVDATRIGHLKKISYVAEGAGADTGVLTPTNLEAFTTITFNAVGDYALLMWNGANWLVIENVGVTLA